MTLRYRTAVVVCAHRPYPTIQMCLRGFRPMLDRDCDLIFVNNGSSESLRTLVSDVSPGITAIELSRNALFCGGYNAGIRAALARGYEFILIANADTEVVNSAFIAELLSAADRWPRAAFLGPLVYYRDEKTIQNTRFNFPSLAHNIFTWIPWRLAPGLFRRAPVEEETDFLNGVCVLCRSAALREVGLMDEQYGAYVEDADWGWRARKLGWSSVFVPVPSVIHHEELEGYEHYSFKSLLLKRNTVRWYLNAGFRFSALAYVLASISLERLRMLGAANRAIRSKHKKFLRDLTKSCRELLFENGGLSPSSDSNAVIRNTRLNS